MIRKKNNYLTYLIISASVIFFLFSFKINILSIGEGGVRLDDFIFLIIAFLIIYYFKFSEVKFPKFYFYYLIFCLICFISAIISSIFQRVEFFYSLLFILRMLQYSFYYFIGFYLAKYNFPFDKVMKVYLLLLLIVVPLQYLQIIPIPSGFGSDRASGNTNGPYELAVIMSFTFFYFSNYLNKNWIFALTSLIVLFLTESRITLASVLIIIFIIEIRKFHFTNLKVFVLNSIIFSFILFYFFNYYLSIIDGDNLNELIFIGRIVKLDLFDTSEILIDAYNASPIYRNSEDYINGVYLSALEYFSNSQDVVDASAGIRFTRWASLIKSTASQYDTILIGLGPSFGSIAIDGFFVRLFVETGMLGLISFTLFLYYSLRWANSNSIWLARYVIVLILSGLFIDIFMSYKAMLLLWLSFGFYSFKKDSN